MRSNALLNNRRRVTISDLYLYDHVPPPQIDAFGLGFRVPCLIISPYAKEGFIDHTQAEFSSILKFVEAVHSLPPLTQRDARASNLFEAFEFSQSPRPPLILPGPYVPYQYPLTLTENASFLTKRLRCREGTCPSRHRLVCESPLSGGNLPRNPARTGETERYLQLRPVRGCLQLRSGGRSILSRRKKSRKTRPICSYT